jgi:hypothetical protein
MRKWGHNFSGIKKVMSEIGRKQNNYTEKGYLTISSQILVHYIHIEVYPGLLSAVI